MNVLKNLFQKQPQEKYQEDSLDRIFIEIEEAKKAFDFAQQNLDNAEGPFVDVAAVEFELAKTRLNALLKKYKEEKAKNL